MSAVAQRAEPWLTVHSTPIFAEAQFAFSALIFLSGQAGFSTVLTASALSSSSPHQQARRSSKWPVNPLETCRGQSAVGPLDPSIEG